MKICDIPVVFDPSAPRLSMARGIWPFKRIVVGPAWYALTPEERVGVLYHEARHCIAFHMEQRLLLLPLLLLMPSRISRLCRAQEFDCDRFAAAHGWGPALASTLERFRVPEDAFYPSSAERAAKLKEAPCKP